MALIVVPLLIEQYPELLKENRFVLPISVAVVVFCWTFPLFRHNRTAALYELAMGGGVVRKVAAGTAVAAAICGIAWGSIRLFKFHSDHLSRVLAAKISPPPVVLLPQRAYDLTEEKRKKFLDVAGRQQKSKRDPIRVACTDWSESSCVAAGKFLILLSQAGWTIDGKQVFRERPLVPTEGVSLVTRPTKAQLAKKRKLPPHLGIWAKMDESQVTMWAAFTQIQIPINSASDESLPSGELGVYFGPEPISH